MKMITHFKIFENWNMSNATDHWVKGAFMTNYDDFKDNIEGIILFLKRNDIEYKIFYKKTNSNFFIILFPKLRYYKDTDIKVAINLYNKEADKFPKDENDEYRPCLISIDKNDNVLYEFDIVDVFLAHIKDMTEIKIDNDDDISKLDYTLDVISKSNKYNL